MSEVSVTLGETEFTVSVTADKAEALREAVTAMSKKTDAQMQAETDPVIAELKSGKEIDPVMTARPEKAEAGKSVRERKPSKVNAHIAQMNRNFGRF